MRSGGKLEIANPHNRHSRFEQAETCYTGIHRRPLSGSQAPPTHPRTGRQQLVTTAEPHPRDVLMKCGVGWSGGRETGRSSPTAGPRKRKRSGERLFFWRRRHTRRRRKRRRRRERAENPEPNRELGMQLTGSVTQRSSWSSTGHAAPDRLIMRDGSCTEGAYAGSQRDELRPDRCGAPLERHRDHIDVRSLRRLGSESRSWRLRPP